jgi:DNA-binding LacI/PurR family transcriptional regulator
LPARNSRPRLEDVAARAGVSTASASLVLRDKPGPSQLTREAVLAAVEDLGYRADRTASLLARRRTQLLGVTMDVRSAFHGELLEDIHLAADARGYDVVVSPLTRARTERHAVETLLDSRCEGVLLLGSTLRSAELSRLASELAVVVVGRDVRIDGVDVVRAADDRGVGYAVEHLVGLGHRDIAFVDGPHNPIATVRRRGYRHAVRRLLGQQDALVLPGGDTEAAGADAVAGLAQMPTALVAFNDRAALGVLDQLRSRGLEVPGDVSVVGFDDTPVARLATVNLTTVSQDPEALAGAAVHAAIERLDGRQARLDVVLEPRLVVRGSTGSPPA